MLNYNMYTLFFNFLFHMKTKLLIAGGLVIASLSASAYFYHSKSDTDHKLKKYLKQRGLEKSDYEPYLKVADGYGCRLEDIAAKGLLDVNNGNWKKKRKLGIRVCSKEDYGNTFGPVMEKLIIWYHKLDSDFKNFSDLNYNSVSALNPDPDGTYIMSARVRVARNIKDMPFRKVQDLKSTLETEKLISSALSSLDGKLSGTYYPIKSLSEEDIKNLVETNLLFTDMKKSETFIVSGIAKDFTPEGSGIFYNQDKTFTAWINEEDHLRLISIKKGSDMKATFQTLVESINKLSKNLSFEKHDRYGYLASCPSNIGTGLRASFLINLPKLSKDKKKLEELASKYSLDIRGHYGEEDNNPDSCIFDISNSIRIGETEVDLINNLILATAEIIQTEKTM